MYLLIILLLALFFFIILPNLFPIILTILGISLIIKIFNLLKNKKPKTKKDNVIEGEYTIREENNND